MTFEELDKLTAMYKENVKITRDNIEKKILECSTYYAMWVDLHGHELRKLRQYEADLTKLYGEIHLALRKKSDIKLTEKSLERYTLSDDKYHALSVKVGNQQVIVQKLEDQMRGYKDLSYIIKNYIELMKIRGI